MAKLIPCPQCGTPYPTPAGVAGATVQCRRCQRLSPYRAHPLPQEPVPQPAPFGRADVAGAALVLLLAGLAVTLALTARRGPAVTASAACVCTPAPQDAAISHDDGSATRPTPPCDEKVKAPPVTPKDAGAKTNPTRDDADRPRNARAGPAAVNSAPQFKSVVPLGGGRLLHPGPAGSLFITG